MSKMHPDEHDARKAEIEDRMIERAEARALLINCTLCDREPCEHPAIKSRGEYGTCRDWTNAEAREIRERLMAAGERQGELI